MQQNVILSSCCLARKAQIKKKIAITNLNTSILIIIRILKSKYISIKAIIKISIKFLNTIKIKVSNKNNLFCFSCLLLLSNLFKNLVIFAKYLTKY